ncbi:MAG TPA: GAF domain-containing sensor histidine kinase, partial [Polyangia bacterium]|nr:GAF domain-containing sensor histidine kinase [Polyangia bacterium]
ALEAQRRAAAEAQSERACLMSHASLLVSRSLDLQEIAQRAVQFTLPKLADWAALDLLDDGAIKRLAIAHGDPAKQTLIDEYAAQFPPRASGPHASVEANRLDQSVLIPQVTDDILRRYNFTPAHIEWLHKLGIQSALAVLIRVPDSLRAALILVSAKRAYDFSDLKLAEEFGERVGTALNNARLYRQATDALRARDEFLALAAHELRTPLTSLRVSCEHLLTQAAEIGENTIVKPAQRILRQSRRLSRLVNRMLDASLAGRRAPAIYPERVDLVALVREVIDELSKTHAPIETDLPASLVGHWDGDRLQQVVGNLLDNALKYGRGQPVRVTLVSDATQATLTVADKGIGIDPERLPHLFEPYERGESSRNYGGLGLGLFLSRQIVAAHGGTLRVRSQREIGSEFTVTLPLAPAPAT